QLIRRRAAVVRDQRLDVRLADLAILLVARLREAVGIEQQPLAASERAVLLFPRQTALDAERIRADTDAVDHLAVRAQLEHLRMAGERRAERAVGREQDVAAGEKRSRAAGAAEDAIERSDDRRRRGIDVELRA